MIGVHGLEGGRAEQLWIALVVRTKKGEAFSWTTLTFRPVS